MGNNGPLQLFGDFGFVGGEDTAPNYLQNAQTCINWYAEVDQQNPKEVLALLGCPGLVQLTAAPGGGAPGFLVTGLPSAILLMHFDGGFTDDAGHIFTLVNSGTPVEATAVINSSNKEFGTGSLSTDVAWGSPYHYAGYASSSTDFGIFDGDWTIEFWFYKAPAGVSATPVCFGLPGNTTSGANQGLIYVYPYFELVFGSTGQLSFLQRDIANAFFSGSSAGSISLSTWHHIAVVCHAHNIVIYFDGINQGPGNSASTTSGLGSAVNVQIALGGTFTNSAWPMYNPDCMDELRISAFAVYTANFTPPSGPFTFSAGSKTTNWAQPSTVTNLPVRGTWELPNDQTALAVIGNTCYLVTVVTPAVGPPSPPSFATLALTNVGTLLTTYGPVHIRDNNVGGYAVIVDGPYGYLYNIKTQAFSRITDPAFLGADTVAFIDGWWIFNQPGTQTFYTNAVQYGITFNASQFALKDSSADNLVAVFENKEQLWLIGDKTTEIWYDAGGQYFPFQRLVGTPIQAGCKAKHSVARFSSGGQDGIMWFGRSERGENVILRTKGFAVDTVSTPNFGDEVATYPITADAIAYTYQEDTHEFYVLTFPTQDVTWCYDSQSGLLHKRLSYDPYLQQFHRHRSNCFMNFQGMRIVGDYQCGALFQLTRSVQTDAAWPLWARRRSPHIWDKGQRGRVFMASLQVDFKPGVGNASGLGSNPQAGLTISRDGGKTSGQRWQAPIGQIGQYKTRTMWRRLGFGRDNVVEIDVIDPVPRDIIGVTLKAFSSA
jgi:hypothetical protein